MRGKHLRHLRQYAVAVLYLSAVLSTLPVACSSACSSQASDASVGGGVAHPGPSASIAALFARMRLPVLPKLQRQRLNYVFDAAELVRESWPGMTPERTCLMLIEADRQWVVNCELAPPGFEQTRQHFRERPVFVHLGDTLDSDHGRMSTGEWLSTTPAAAHVPAPNTPASLPGADPWLVLGTLEALSTFHPSFKHATTEAWVSVAVHEFVHTHQLRAAGFAPYLAAVDTHVSNPATLTTLYTSHPGFRAQIEREYALLSQAAARDARDKPAAYQALRSWWALYLKRNQWLDRAGIDAARVIADDALFSYIEGVARFVESDFLANTAQHPPEPTTRDARFHAYEEFVGRDYSASPNRQLDSQYFYAIGYHLCVLLERVDPRWKSSVHTRSHWLLGMVRELAVKDGER